MPEGAVSMEVNPRDRWRRKRFKENLDRLLTARGLTRRAAADAAGVNYDWLRRAVSRGIAWPDKRSMERLKKLGDRLGLENVERLWGNHFVVPPEPSSIQDDADKLGEEMRKYALLVGSEDATLQGIIQQMRRAVFSAQIAKIRGNAPPASPSDPGVPACVERGSDSTGIPSSTSQTSCAARPSVTSSRSDEFDDEDEFDDKDEFDDEDDDGEESEWDYEDDINSGDESDSKVETLAERIARIKQAQSLLRADSSRNLNFIRQCLDTQVAERLAEWRAAGLPRIDEVVISPEDVANTAEAYEDMPEDLMAAFALEHVWLPVYARVLGLAEHEAIDFIKSFVTNNLTGGGDDMAHPHEVQATSGGAESVMDRNEDAARAAAKTLVVRVLEHLTPEQADDFLLAYPSVERAETYLEDELVNRLLAIRYVDGECLPQQTPEEAVLSVVAEIVKEFENSRTWQ